jgi:hypothetical protein
MLYSIPTVSLTYQNSKRSNKHSLLHASYSPWWWLLILPKHGDALILICNACNETNLMHYLSSVYSVTIPLHVSRLLLAHKKEVKK